MSGLVGVPPGTTTAQLPDGRVVQFTDWIDDQHYSTVQWQSGDNSSLDAFSQGKSQQIVGGTRANTDVDVNIPRSGVSGLPRAWEFNVYSLQIELTRATRTSGSNSEPLLTDYSDPVALITMFDMNRKIYCEYKYNNKVYSSGVMIDYPAAAGANFQGTANAVTNVTNGPPDVTKGRAMVIPIIEIEDLSYSMTLTPQVALSFSQPALDSGTALNFVDMRVKKKGLIKRNVN